MIEDKIAELDRERTLLQAIYQDFVADGVLVVNMRTDAVYEMFCKRHPDIVIARNKFTRAVCRELGLKSKQAWLDGVRGSFYEC